MSKEFWNDRYAASDYAYGTEPSLFLQQQLPLIAPGSILFPAEGEGRNAVYAAQLGWDVAAFDHSEKGQAKALALARSRGVTIDYRISSFERLDYEPEQFDAIALVFVHPPAGNRRLLHQTLVSYLSPGGTILLEGFSKEQLRFDSGGPKEESLLFSLDEIKKDFDGMIFFLLSKEIVILKEGKHHDGEASVIRCVAKKK